MTHALAQLTNPVIPPLIGAGGTQKGGTALGMLLGNIIGALIIVAFVLAIIFLLTGAFHWITSGGDKANLENARNKIIHAIVGLIVMASVWAIMTIVSQFLGISFPDLKIPSIPSGS